MRTPLPAAACILLAASTLGAQAPAIVDPELAAASRQFDFWLGRWSVNLRIHQQDLSWKDAVHAEARIHSVLRGKAFLELWGSDGIKGMSLRYFDPALERWVMWLDWPGRNRSGSFRLEGGFRHGRAEFEARRLDSDGTETRTRYTFSDITDRSVRWDDAFSRDGGDTWSHNWIMEFTRTAPTAKLPPEGGDAHTYVDGTRCALQSFHRWDAWAGRRGGTMGGEPATLRGYRILDGCAVLLTVSYDGRPGEEWLGQLTFNTYVERAELLALGAAPAEPARVFHTSDDPTDALFTERVQDGVPMRRVRIERAGGAFVLVWEERAGGGAPWRETRRGTFR
jgi:hypothetical protein